jgi:hypothetical protein
MAFVLLCALISSSCRRLSGSETRVHLTAGCVIVSGARLRALRGAADGGAVYIGRGVTAEVTDSSFTACAASSTGGALSLECAAGSVARCCGAACFAARGHFMHLGSDRANRSCLLLSVVECARAALRRGTRGAIHSDAATVTDCAAANFTACAAGEGAAVQTRGAARESRFSCRFVAIVGCAGQTGIDSVSGGAPLIALCNVYNNSMQGAMGVLHARESALVIRRCIFSGNTRDVSGAGGIRIEDCFFSAPADAFEDASFSLSGNRFSTSVPAHAIAHFGPELCAASPPAAQPVKAAPKAPTRSRSPSRSQSRSPARSRSPSRSLTATASFHFNQSRPAFAATPPCIPTRALLQSGSFSVTAPASPSNPASPITGAFPSHEYRDTPSLNPTLLLHRTSSEIESKALNATDRFDPSLRFSRDGDGAGGGSVPTSSAGLVAGVVLALVAIAAGAAVACFLLCRSKRTRMHLSDSGDMPRDVQFVNESTCDPDTTFTDSTATYEGQQTRAQSTIHMTLFESNGSLPAPIW